MRIYKLYLIVLITIIGFVSCSKDDDGGLVQIPDRDRGEQQMADNDSLIEYLTNHYYNSSDFTDPTLAKISDLVITELPEGGTVPDGSTLLLEAVGTPKKVVFAETNYDLYILKLNQGGGTNSPTFADDVRVRYEGFNLSNSVFDSAVTPVDFDLTSLIPAWRKVLPDFNDAESFADGTDGTVNFMNHGAGVMFVPSGLAYFANSVSGISAYSPIIFKFELLQTSERDHDNDGIPSYKEDLNGDGEFTVNFDDLEDPADDDTDGDGFPNYLDNDDDGDGVLTINEDIDGDGDPTNDIGKNGIPKYLDPEETESNE
ncbi:hypothetical protein [Algibacter aquimarinus]|uniref:peptidylprolyl isomerase n=1 Tax=Algibacter aquimarinus TaxID=1136748 RepID=A0ABP9HL71_9FLAO